MTEFIRWIRLQWDRALAIGLVAIGAVALVVGWVGASGALVPAAQLPYLISGGLGGLFLLGLGATLWLSADLRDEWRKLDRIDHALVHQLGAHDHVGPSNGSTNDTGISAPTSRRRPARPLEAARTRR